MTKLARLPQLLGSAGSIAALAGLLAGCAATEAAKRDIREASQQVTSILEAQKKPFNEIENRNLRRAGKVWLGDRGRRNENGVPLPASTNTLTLTQAVPLSIREIAAEITAATKIPVRLDNGVENPMSSGDGTTSLLGEAAGIEYMEVMWKNAPLAGFLDQVSTRFKVRWSYDGETITLYRYDTETFSIYALPVDSEGTVTVSSDGENTQLSDPAVQGLKSTATLKIWDEITENLKTIVSDAGTFTVNRSIGTVTVSAEPAVMRRVASFLKEQNARLTRQVILDVKVATLSVADSDDYGFDLEVIAQGLQSGLDVSFGSLGNALGSGGSLGVVVNKEGATLNGSSAVLQAMSTLGDVKLVANNQILALNNQPAPVNVVRSQNYVSDISRENDGDSTTFSIETDTIVSGFKMSLLPRILDQGEVLISYSLNLSQLRKFDEFTAGEDQVVQLPDVDARSFTQQAIMRSGDVMIVSGFQQENAAVSKSGVGDPNFPLLGGSNSASVEKTMVVVLITPKILDMRWTAYPHLNQ